MKRTIMLMLLCAGCGRQPQESNRTNGFVSEVSAITAICSTYEGMPANVVCIGLGESPRKLDGAVRWIRCTQGDVDGGAPLKLLRNGEVDIEGPLTPNSGFEQVSYWAQAGDTLSVVGNPGAYCSAVLE